MTRPVRIGFFSNVVEKWDIQLHESDGRFSIVAESQFATRVTLGSNLTTEDIKAFSESLLRAAEQLTPKTTRKPKP